MSALPIVWLCGPSGVGKSAVGWDLFSRWASQGRMSGYIDIDQLALRFPRGSAEDHATRIKATNLARLLPNYAAEGAQRIVISGIASPSEVPVFDGAAGPIRWVRLSADRGELHRRVMQRDGSSELLEDIDRHADELAASDFAALTIDTTNASPAMITDEIDDAIRLAGQPIEQPSLDQGEKFSGRPGAGGPRVVMLTGPRVVGTSSIGWELLMLIQAETPTALIDLAQIGFVNDGDDLTVRRHRLRAANLAAMVRTYHDDGCQLLIAVGRVLSTEDRDTYASVLAPGSLSLTRLHATPAELERRIHARTAPTGDPHLAGDDLRNRRGIDVDRVLQQALQDAKQLDRSDFADHALDTTNLSVAEAAEMIRASVLRARRHH